MEIPEINMITDFQAGMKCLQNPNLVSRFFSIEAFVPKFQFYYSFWKWGALILAIYATFSSLVRKIRLAFVYFHGVRPSLLQQKLEQILEFTDDDDDDEVSSASSSVTSSDDEREDGDDDCFRRVKGSRLWLQGQWQGGNLRRSSWACSSTKNNVVRFWGFDRGHDGGRETEEEDSWNFRITAEESSRKGAGVLVRGYDGRLRRRTPAICGEWSAAASGDVSAAVSCGKVFVRDDASGVVAVGDVRNMRIPLSNLTAGTDGVSVEEGVVKSLMTELFVGPFSF